MDKWVTLHEIAHTQCNGHAHTVANGIHRTHPQDAQRGREHDRALPRSRLRAIHDFYEESKDADVEEGMPALGEDVDADEEDEPGSHQYDVQDVQDAYESPNF